MHMAINGCILSMNRLDRQALSFTPRPALSGPTSRLAVFNWYILGFPWQIPLTAPVRPGIGQQKNPGIIK